MLFPAFCQLVSAALLRALGEQFEEIEHQEFGKDGVSEIVRHVERLRRQVDITSLRKFTPQLPGRTYP